MADEKEAKGKKEEKKSGVPAFEVLLGEIIGIVLLGYLILRLLGAFGGGSLLTTAKTFLSAVLGSHIATGLIIAFIIVSNILSILFLGLIIYATIRISEINVERKKMYFPEKPVEAAHSNEDPKWQRILTHISSTSPGDWRIAILEADIMLDDVLDKLGYVGDTMGDKLKKVDKGDFKSLDAAWEAHKIRNAIAHEGQDFTITEREAKRVISLYESIFREFGLV